MVCGKSDIGMYAWSFQAMNIIRKNIVYLLFLLLLSSAVFSQGVDIARYNKAYSEMENMLRGNTPLSIKRAVFLAENAYLDGKLDYEKDFCEPLRKGADYMKRMITVNHWENYKTAKQIALCNFFFTPCSGNGQSPFLYDFSNELPVEDWQHQLVSRTIKTHKGRCRSLPWTYKLYAEELGADVHIAHAPRHTFIMYKNEDYLFPEEWINVETTAQQYQPTWVIKEHFFIADSAIAAGTYMTPLTDIQTVACQLADLAFGYYKKYKRYDEFTLQCVDESLKFYPKNPNAIIIKMRSLEALLSKHLMFNGYLRDYYTDIVEAQYIQCAKELQSTYWTQETEELRKKWNMTQEEADSIRRNQIFINK